MNAVDARELARHACLAARTAGLLSYAVAVAVPIDHQAARAIVEELHPVALIASVEGLGEGDLGCPVFARGLGRRLPRDLVLVGADAAWGLPMAVAAYAAGARRLLVFRGAAHRLEAMSRVVRRKAAAAVITRTPLRSLAASARGVTGPRLRALAAEPLLPPDAFVAGRVVLVNGALGVGGVERQIVNTLQGLRGQPRVERSILLCTHVSAVPDGRFYAPMLEGSGAEIAEPLSLPGAIERVRGLVGPRFEAVEDAFASLPEPLREDATRVLAELLVLRPEVVHAWQDDASITAGFAAALAGVPRIVVAGRNVRPTRFASHRRRGADLRAAYRTLAEVERVAWLNNSDAGAEDYARWLGLPRARFRVVRNAVDAGACARAPEQEVRALRRRLGIPEGARVVGSIFRLYPEKRPMLWLDAAAHIAPRRADVHFVLMGDGPLRPELERRAQELRLAGRVHLPGASREVALALSAMDVVLLTSEFEGTPNVLLEAQLLGIPVVSTDAGGAAEAFVPGRTGRLVHRAAAGPIARAVIEVLDEPSMRSRVAAEGPEHVRQRFGLARMIDETLEVYGLARR